MSVKMNVGVENLLSIQEARERARHNQQKILRFLYKEKYSTSSILTTVLGLKNRRSTCAILRKMVEVNLVRKHVFNRQIVLWGITPHGIHSAIDNGPLVTDWIYFEPSKVNITTLDHQLNIQAVHAICEIEDLGFVPGRALGSRQGRDKLPDGVIKIGEHDVALELERHIKSRRRYDAILYNYLKAIKAGQYSHIVYVAPDKNQCQKVKKVFYSLKKITMNINGRKQALTIIPEKHLRFFDFVSLEDVQEYLYRLKTVMLT